MQFLLIDSSTTLSQLADLAGDRNVEYLLAANDLPRVPNIGQVFKSMCDEIVQTAEEVPWQKKFTILNTFTSHSDIFEAAALLGSSGWKVLESLNTFSNALRIPESIVLPDSARILGNSVGVSKAIYTGAMLGLTNAPHYIDPSIFNEFSSIKHSILGEFNLQNTAPFQWFKLPWGEITLYSSIDRNTVDFPVYPTELSDGVHANYTQMPDMLYQYEPWQLYQSSGPRSNTYTFDFHRDMWTGDHRDGKANELIRFCEANCYPEYNGSAVNTSTVTLYIAGKPHITGVVTDVTVNWDGPIGLDGWYLHCSLELSITEVAQEPLNYTSVKHKSLIG